MKKDVYKGQGFRQKYRDLVWSESRKGINLNYFGTAIKRLPPWVILLTLEIM